jgi:hypothetical protein
MNTDDTNDFILQRIEIERLTEQVRQLENPWISVDDERKPEVGQWIWTINYRGFREAYLYNSYLFSSAEIIHWALEPQLPIEESL